MLLVQVKNKAKQSRFWQQQTKNIVKISKDLYVLDLILVWGI